MSRPLFLAVSFLLLNLFLWACGGACADELEVSRERLSRIQQRIESTQRSLKQKTTEIISLRDELRSVDKELRRLSRQQQRLKQQLADNAQQQKETSQQVAKLRKQAEAQRNTLERRLSSLYKGGGGGVVKLLFSGMGPTELDAQFRYTLRVVQHDRDLLDGYQRQQLTLENKLQELEGLKKRHSADLVTLKKHHKVLASASSLKNKILAKVRKDQRLLASLKKELEAKAQRLTGLVDNLESGSRSSARSNAPFARQRGKLPWPVKGKVRIGFGPQRHPDLGTLFDSNGIEIDVSEQTPIKALWEGRVAFASAFKGYGNLVIVDHGDGFHTLYAQAARIVQKVDDRVKQGEVLAYSGFPGSNGVYLEIRRQGKPVDPENWLSRK